MAASARAKVAALPAIRPKPASLSAAQAPPSRVMPSRRKHSVRIVGGDLRGRELVYPAGRALRPTTSRTREAVFDVLGEEVRGCVFIDLFAGGGAIGIEALSRGAASCHFVEASREVAGYLRRNIERLMLPPDRARGH